MIINEIMLMFFLPVALFLFIQLIMLLKFHDIAIDMILGRRLLYLLCKYDDCANGSPTCFTNNGLNIITLRNNVRMPFMCHNNNDILKDEQKLNPFRRITEDYIVMFLSISLMMISLHILDIKIITPDRIWDLIILVSLSVFFTVFILVLPNEKISMASTILGLNTIFALFINYTIYIYDITWESFPNIYENIISKMIYNIFSHNTLMEASIIAIVLPVILLFSGWKIYRITQA